MEHLFLMFLDHTQRRTTVGRTPLDEWSARRRDLYLTTHDTHNRKISMPPVGFKPKISAGERPQAWGVWIFVCCECRVLSGRGLCDELITRPEESYRMWCVVVCDLETSRMGAPYVYDISRLRVKGIYSNVTLSLNMSCLNIRLDRKKLFFLYQLSHCRIGHFCIKYLCVFLF